MSVKQEVRVIYADGRLSVLTKNAGTNDVLALLAAAQFQVLSAGSNPPKTTEDEHGDPVTESVNRTALSLARPVA